MPTKTVTPTLQTGKVPGSTLKIIAMVCMVIDHIAATLLDRVLVSRGLMDAAGSQEAINSFLAQSNNSLIYNLDMIMRSIGRISFPIFCFLLIEGFLHTHNVRKYALNLGIFALLSEVPFDLAFSGKPFYLGYQNVFFTLFLGLLMLICLKKAEDKFPSDASSKGISWKQTLIKIVVILIFCLVAFLLQCDYNAIGILAIGIMYNLRHSKMSCIGAGCVVLTLMSLSEITCFLAMIPVYFYNGERGLKVKYPFYLFYPVHLLLLFGIACLMHIGGVSVV